MNSQELFISGTIAILYPFFFSKLASVVSGKSAIDDLCKHNHNARIYSESSKFDQACDDHQKVLSKQAETTKFIILMIAGVVGIIFSGYFSGSSTMLGLSLGGFLTIFTAIFVYWNNMGEYLKLGITGTSLASLIYVSINLVRLGAFYK